MKRNIGVSHVVHALLAVMVMAAFLQTVQLASLRGQARETLRSVHETAAEREMLLLDADPR